MNLNLHHLLLENLPFFLLLKGVDDQLYHNAQDLPLEIKEAQQKKLEDLKKQQDIQNRLAVERKIFLRYRRIKFFGEYVLYEETGVCSLVEMPSFFVQFHDMIIRKMEIVESVC